MFHLAKSHGRKVPTSALRVWGTLGVIHRWQRTGAPHGSLALRWDGSRLKPQTCGEVPGWHGGVRSWQLTSSHTQGLGQPSSLHSSPSLLLIMQQSSHMGFALGLSADYLQLKKPQVEHLQGKKIVLKKTFSTTQMQTYVPDSFPVAQCV